MTVSQQSQPMGRQEIDSGPSLRPVRPPCLARKKFEYRVSGDELGDYANILKQLICKKVKLKIIAKSILYL